MTYSTEQFMANRPLLILAGPTAVGKTALSVRLAKRLDGEIISADSMQVYKGMDIGSAKITKSEMDGVPHHLIDILSPEEEFNIRIFQQLAKQAVQDIYSRNRIPIIAGGTGFYIQSLLYDIHFTEETSSECRKMLEEDALRMGNHSMHERLRSVDPVSAELIHENNSKRVIRALEFYQLNSYPISEHNQTEKNRSSDYSFRYYILNQNRETLYRNIEVRIDQMMSAGLLQEVSRLKNQGCTREMVSMQGLGYKELLAYLDHTCSLSEAIEQIKESTRHFAKRQLTWFRREKDAIWLNKEDYDGGLPELEEWICQDFRHHIMTCK